MVAFALVAGHASDARPALALARVSVTHRAGHAAHRVAVASPATGPGLPLCIGTPTTRSTDVSRLA